MYTSGDFVKTSPLNLYQWIITVTLGFLGIPIGILMRLIPITEDPHSFFTADFIIKKEHIQFEREESFRLEKESSDKMMRERRDSLKNIVTVNSAKNSNKYVQIQQSDEENLLLNRMSTFSKENYSALSDVREDIE